MTALSLLEHQQQQTQQRPSDDESPSSSSSSSTSNNNSVKNDTADVSSGVIRVFLAPMVRGSEYAFRRIVASPQQQSPTFSSEGEREGGRRNTNIQLVSCYSPMLRANEIVKAFSSSSSNHNDDTSSNDLHHEDVRLFLQDVVLECQQQEREEERKPSPSLTVQLCGNSPTILAQATKIILQKCCTAVLKGIDLNLGCPQSCARRDGFGSFLAIPIALQCIQAMKQVIIQQQHSSLEDTKTNSIQLSCKIRLLETTEETIEFVQQLQKAGCDFVAVHCRRRTDKHDGIPDLVAAQQIVLAVNMPIILNGFPWITTTIDGYKEKGTTTAIQALHATKAYGVMIARDFLRNPQLLLLEESSSPSTAISPPPSPPTPPGPEILASLYLESARQYPPPSHLYIQNHLRWIFRAELEPPTIQQKNDGDYYKKEWKPKLWTFLARPYVNTWEQYSLCVILFCYFSDNKIPTFLQPYETSLVKEEISFNSIRHYYHSCPSNNNNQQEEEECNEESNNHQVDKENEEGEGEEASNNRWLFG